MKRIVFLGDSVTEGCFECIPAECGFETVRKPEKGYVEGIKKLLGDRAEVINAGVSGNNTRMALERIDTDVIEKKPDICVVCLGLNDLFSTFERYSGFLGQIFDRLNSAVIKAVFLTPNTTCFYLHPELIEATMKIAQTIVHCNEAGKPDEFFGRARALAEQKGAEVCDFYGFCRRREALGSDMTSKLSNKINHPDEELYREMAAFLAPTLMKML